MEFFELNSHEDLSNLSSEACTWRNFAKWACEKGTKCRAGNDFSPTTLINNPTTRINNDLKNQIR